MIRVILADDHQITTDGIQAFLSNEAEITVVGAASNGEEVLALLEKEPADVAVLDIEMPGMDGLEATRAIRQQFPGVKVLVLSMYKKKAFVKGAFEMGASGYVLKDRSKEALVSAIHTVFRGGRYIPPELLDLIFSTSEPDDTEAASLTSREKEILCLLAEGLTSRETGEALNIASVTVETHIRNIKSKLGINKKAQLVKYVLDHGLCE
ncbi:MAG: response regulator transcription factor [Phaeodactylibacter sp.]|nr:response regulator transcription factor [Phaeodactylibacter sp.]MCB9276825.1 response regulator transcription factor [Lewinellaceae bacterium]